MTLYYLQYANYFNRIVKHHTSVLEYTEDPTCFTIDVATGINFVPNDGVSATQVWNAPASAFIPDYVLVVDEDSLIVSRWYVIRSARLRGGQYQLELMRDVIADWYDSIIFAPMFIRKATLTAGNPLLFNSENMTYNQIKIKETPIKDITGIPWIVGYIDKDFTASIQVGTPTIGEDYIVDDLSEYKYYKYSLSPMKTELGRIFRFNFYDGGGLVPFNTSYCFAWNDYGGAVQPSSPSPETGEYFAGYTYKKSSGAKKIGYRVGESSAYYGTVGLNKVQPYVKSQDWFSIRTKNCVSNIDSQLTISRLELENGKIIRVGQDPTNSTYYRINVEKLPQSTSIVSIDPSSGLGLMMSGLTDTLNEVGFLYNSGKTYTDPRFELEVQHTNTQIILTEVYSGQLTIDLLASRPHTNNCPYDIFCIPYGEIKVGASAQTVSTQISLQIASKISKEGGGQNAAVYDIQLLPFCPLAPSRFNVAANRLTLREGDQYAIHPNEPTKIFSALCWVDEAEFSFTIDDPAYTIKMPENAVDIKIMNETQVFRLVSPNYNGMFEFSPAKNQGITAYDIDCAYKPYTPYIKIAPRFNGLYGKDFNDARGLICGGDFSLSQITDAWEKYQIENKNYENIFQTQLNTMDEKNKIQKTRDIVSASVGTVQGAASGAMAGSFIGGGYGAAAGAVLGGVASGVAGWADVKLNQKSYQLDKQLTQDLYDYNLGNIQALPASITKVSSFNPNNKIFPILEEYSATAEEEQALRNKLTYNGMTVMTIGTINQHLQPDYSFIQGDLIRMESLGIDYQVSLAIANELDKGVYIK